MYVRIRIEQKSVACTYVRSLHWKAKLTMNPDRERDRETDSIKHRGSYRTLFSFKGGSLEKARSQLPKFCLNKN